MTSLRRPDPRTVVLSGLTTWAWYAVPDVVGPRWGRALAKSAVAVAGAALAVAVTRDGRELRASVRQAGEAVRSTLDGVAASAEAPLVTDQAGRAAGPATDGADRALLGGPDDGEEVVVRAPWLTGAVLAGVAASVALGVAGEKWVHRRGEALRARGVSAPHTRVGLVVGLAAAALAVVDPDLDDADAPDAARAA